ncbi:MAG TPA: hypothetical protein VNM87_00980, partial [Candidatus Udaeobacter sp.]|nr:hypothetical protein [Candidatus Udaeobacter sp.]
MHTLTKSLTSPYLLALSLALGALAGGEGLAAEPPAAGPATSDIASRGVTFDPARSPFPPALHARVVSVIDHIYNFEFAAAESEGAAIRR